MGQPPPGRAQTVAAPTAPAAGLALADALRRATRLALGAAGLALDGAQALLERSVPAEPVAGAAARPAPLPQAVRLLPGVVVGVGMEAQRRSLQGAAALGRALGPLASAAVHPVVAHGPLRAVRRRLDLEHWSERGRAEQRRNELAAASFARALLGGVVAAVLEEVDLDAVVARVDLDRVVERLDLDAVVARVDLDAVVARVDLDAVVARVDLDRVVERLDLDAIVARVDVDAIVGRVDLATVTGRVMDEVDVAEIIRESSSTMASETADALRVQGMQADRVLSRIVDRVLLRKGERQTTLGPAPAVGADR